jgi:hypothetical protein
MSDEAILSVEMEIKAVSVKLDELEAAIKDARAAQDKDEVAALRKNEEQLRKKEEQLRKEKEQLRAEKLLLLARQPGALCPSPQFMWRLAFTRAAVVLSGRSSSGSERGSPPEAASALALAAVVACRNV